VEPEIDASEITIPVVTPPAPKPLLPPQRKVYVTAFQTTDAGGFIELYNSDTKVQSIRGWRVEFDFTDESMCSALLDGYIFSGKKVLVVREGGSLRIDNALAVSCDDDASKIVQAIRLYDKDQLIEELLPPQNDVQIWSRKNTTSTYLTGNFLKDFEPGDKYTVTDGYWYVPPLMPEIQILEVLVNPKSCTPAEEGPICYDFIKLKNNGTTDVDLSDYRLRSGFSNSVAAASNTEYLVDVLAPGQIKTITHNRLGARVSFATNDGTVWLEDVEGVVSYDMKVAPYTGSGLTSKKGLSWAYDDMMSAWRWAVPSPESEGVVFFDEAVRAPAAVRELVPCKEGQYRSPETNRCRTIEVASILKPCKEGQYRSEETNRCRSIALTVAAAKPCAEDQFRNPLTNRCKKIASTEDVSLADCGEGRERNPLTNRCRNSKASTPPKVGFSVEKVASPASVFIGWWVVGGIVLAVIGYSGWEWREEIGRAVRRIFRPGISSK
jgi:hypothetical protein